MIRAYVALALALALAPACQDGAKNVERSSAAPPTPAAPKPQAQVLDIDSKDLLARSEAAPSVYVKHVLISWKDLAEFYSGGQDPRGAQRTNAEAAALARDVLAKLTAHPEQIDALVKEYSEDPAAKSSTDPYQLRTNTDFLASFKQLSLRLHEHEAGIVRTQYGYHVIERVGAPPLDPFESADILGRPPVKGLALVQHVMIGWKDAPGARQMLNTPTRSKEEADKLAREVLAKAKAGAEMFSLMKEYSDDLGSKTSPRTFEIQSEDDPLPLARLAVRMKPGEVGVIKSLFGWHIVKRLVPPKPDPLESKDVLARDKPATGVKVKHILLGWKEAHSKDPRGAGRDRATLGKLVETTVAKLRAGANIEPLMKTLSEDPKSAATGDSYDVTADSSLVPAFKQLALRLNVGEIGVVSTPVGLDIVKRTE